jgi:hypothetical protein
MNNLVGTVKGIVLLDEKTYQSILSAENSMKLGIYFLVACFIIAAFPTFVGDLVDSVQPFTEERAAEWQDEFLQGFEMVSQFIPVDENFQIFMEQFKENFAYGTRIAVAIDALPRPLPYAVGGFFGAFGRWLSVPFAHLASWMGYAIWVLLFAKISGGRGGVNRFLGLTALYAVPNLLGFLGFIPFLGAVFTLVGVIWGWVVYVKGVQVSQEVSSGKAILLAILPIVVLLVVIFIITFLMGISLAGLANSG